MKQAVEHYNLTVENERLVASLSRANQFLEAVMDHLDTGALAVDAAGMIQAVNRPVRDYLALEGDLRGKLLEQVLESHGLERWARRPTRSRISPSAPGRGRRGAHRAARPPPAHQHAQPHRRQRHAPSAA